MLGCPYAKLRGSWGLYSPDQGPREAANEEDDGAGADTRVVAVLGTLGVVGGGRSTCSASARLGA